MKLSVPTKCLTWGFNHGSTNYSAVRVGVLIEVWNDETNTLIERRWDVDGGVHPDDNHPNGSELYIGDGTRIRLVVRNISKNNFPCQVMIFNSDINTNGNSNDYGTYPIGTVDGVTNQKLHKQLIGGQSTTIIFTLSANTHGWWKINTLAWFTNGTQFTSNPPDATVYADTFSLVYAGGNIRWANPLLTNQNDQVLLPNTQTWATESGTLTNPFYQATGGGGGCDTLTDGLNLGYYTNPLDSSTQQLICKIFSDGLKRILRPKVGTTNVWFPSGKNILTASNTTTAYAAQVSCFAFADSGLSGLVKPSDYVLPPGWIYNGDGSIQSSEGTVVTLTPDVVGSFATNQSATVTASNNDSGIPSGATYRIKDWSRKGVLVGVNLTNPNNGTVEITGIAGNVGDGYFEIELVKDNNVLGTSKVSYTVTQPNVEPYSYQVTEVDNTCQKELDYGIQPSQNGAVSWQSSSSFPNRTELHPFFYIRNTEDTQEISEAYAM